tara:strand:+ start:76 stop:531 length:456 start_codon:yes stop_codon:yes gene_type:complete
MIHITGKIKDGVLIPYEDLQFHNELRKLEGHDVEVTVNSVRLRSNPQNRYYWGTLLYMIREELVSSGYQAGDLVTGRTGNLTRDIVHEVMKELFAKEELYHPETGRVIALTKKSTKDMSTKEFKLYIDNIRQWAVENLSLDIPDPSHLYSI